MFKKYSFLQLFFIALAVIPSVFCYNLYNNFTLWDGFYGLICNIFKVIVLSSLLLFIISMVQKHLNFESVAIGDDYSPNYRLFFIVSFMINMVYLLAYYPGTSYWDTKYQIADYFDGTKLSLYEEGGNTLYTAFLNDHHPVMCAFLFSYFVKIGNVLGSAKLGVFFYGLLQCLLYSYVFVKVLKFIGQKGILSKKLCQLYYLFNPFLSYYAICMSKDSIFAALFVLYMLEYLAVFFKHSSRGKDSVSVALILYSFLIPLVKKTGIYIVILSNLVLLIKELVTHHGSIFPKKALISIILPAATMFFVFPRILFPIIDVYPGGKQEVLATLFQQTALVKLMHEDAYSPEDAAIIDAVFDYDAIEEKFNKGLTDPIKNTYRLSTVSDEQLKEYFKLWLRTGIKYPATYLKATLSTCSGYFSPTHQLEVYVDNRIIRPMSEPTIFANLPTDSTLFEIDLSTSYAPLPSALRDILYPLFIWLRDFPVTSLFSYLVVYTWWTPLLGTYLLIRRRGFWSLFSLSPVYVSILTLIVSPYSFARYVLPFVMVAPLLIFASRGEVNISPRVK